MAIILLPAIVHRGKRTPLDISGVDKTAVDPAVCAVQFCNLWCSFLFELYPVLVTEGSIQVLLYEIWSGPDISVGIATRYRVDGPWIESRSGRDFPHPSRPALGPTHSPIQSVPGLSRG